MAFVEFVKKSHLDRLAYDELRERRSPQGKYYLHATGAWIGFIAQFLSNKQLKKPTFSGLQWYAVAILGGIAFGHWLDGRLLNIQQQKYARIKHYLELHPEDFPPYGPRVKIGDTLQSWYPVRPGW